MNSFQELIDHYYNDLDQYISFSTEKKIYWYDYKTSTGLMEYLIGIFYEKDLSIHLYKNIDGNCISVPKFVIPRTKEEYFSLSLILDYHGITLEYFDKIVEMHEKLLLKWDSNDKSMIDWGSS